jgi:hypothetical protein
MTRVPTPEPAHVAAGGEGAGIQRPQSIACAWGGDAASARACSTRRPPYR